jgi:hypothetical protein
MGADPGPFYDLMRSSVIVEDTVQWYSDEISSPIHINRSVIISRMLMQHTAFDSPVVPLLKQSKAQTSLFTLPLGNPTDPIWLLSPYLLPSSINSPRVRNPSLGGPSRIKTLSCSIPNLSAAPFTTSNAEVEEKINLHLTVFKTCTVSSSVYPGEERADIPPAPMTPNIATGKNTQLGEHIDTTSPGFSPEFLINAVER